MLAESAETARVALFKCSSHSLAGRYLISNAAWATMAMRYLGWNDTVSDRKAKLLARYLSKVMGAETVHGD